MLAPNELCALVAINGKRLTLSPLQAAYGMMSGQSYGSDSATLDRRDQGKEVLLYWKSFPVRVQTTFSGRIPSPENVFDLEVCVSFEIHDPVSLLQHRLRDIKKLSVEAFSEDVAERVRWQISRLACEFSPKDLADRARVESQSRLLQALARIYGPEGLQPIEVDLVKVESHLKDRELQLLLKKIELESEEAGIELEEAYKRERIELNHAAQEGREQARTLVAKMDQAGSYRELQDRVPASGPSVTVGAEGTGAVVTTLPIIMRSESKTGGKFAVLSSKEQPRYHEILRPWFCLGRDANCHVQLSSHGVSSLHCTIARVGSGLAVVDHHSTNGTYCSGERIQQLFIQTGDVLRIDDHWIVFKLEPSQEALAVDHSLRGTIASAGSTLVHAGGGRDFLDGEVSKLTEALVQLASSSGRMASSESRPILIGHDSACELCLEGGGVARFHGIVFWDVDLDSRGGICDGGVYVEDLHSGRGIVLNGSPIPGRAKLGNGDILEMGGHRLTVTLTGDVRKQAETLYVAVPSLRGLAVTCIEGPAAGATVRLKKRRERLIIGSGEQSDLRLTSGEISRRHAEISIDSGDQERSQFFISDCDSTNGTFINGGRIKPNARHRIDPGDIIRLSQGSECCDLLVHYGL